MKIFLISIIAKKVSLISRFFSFGAGVTWAGEISLKLDRNLLETLSKKIKKGIIVVCGTNGKTTTASMLAHVLRSNGNSVIHNDTGANLKNGILGTLILGTNFWGRINSDYAIFEVDEAALLQVIVDVKPKILLLLNLFRDQLDRYGEVDSIANKWLQAITKVEKDLILIANGDDPLISYIGEQYLGKKYYFGLVDKSLDLGLLSHATDSTYCLKCGEKLKYQAVYLSHFGDWSCGKCGFKRPKLDLTSAKSPLLGVYNLYNTFAVLLTTKILGLPVSKAENLLSLFIPAFGRQEIFNIQNKKIQIFLSKNPSGFNESIRTVITKKDFKTIIFALNDRIPDGTDVSWIWDFDIENICSQAKTIICTGDRVYDMGLRVKYAFDNQKEYSKLEIIEDLNTAIKQGLSSTKQNEVLYIFPTYSAMLDIRKILTGRKIL